MKRFFKWLWKYLRPFTNWKFLISFGLAWMITNGWSYLFVGFGIAFKIDWMLAIGSGYQAFLWLPMTPEKLVTIPMAIWFHTILFKRDDKTHKQLQDMYAQAKADWNKIKSKFKKNKRED